MADPTTTATRSPERVALDLHARLKRAERNGRALRDVVASLADLPEAKGETVQATLHIIVKAYDEAMAAI